MKKIKKLKRGLKIIGILLLIIVVTIPIFKTSKKNSNDTNLINEVYTKVNDSDITVEFLNWVNDNYADSLERLDKLLNEEDYRKELWHQVTGNSYIVLQDLYNDTYKNYDNVKIVAGNNVSTLSFVGDISLADNYQIMPEYDKRGQGVLGILSEDILDVMKTSDILVANNEFTVSNRGTKIAKLFNFKAAPERLSIYFEMGVDLVTLANNHVYDYGTLAFDDMLDYLDEYKIPHIGAGKNIKAAMQPYYFILNGYKIAFVNATRAEKNIVTPEATETSSGVFRCYDPTNMVNLIKNVKKESDYVIAIIHYGKEGSHELESEQISSSKMYIEAGADAVIGHHAHRLQGIEFYQDKPIMYNLGDFIFNNKTEDTGIFQIKMADDGTMEYYFYPALQSNAYTKLLSGSEKQKLIEKMINWSVNATINSDGKITQIES